MVLGRLKQKLVPPRKMIANFKYFCSRRDAAFSKVGCKQIQEHHLDHYAAQIEFSHSSIQAQNRFLKQSSKFLKRLEELYIMHFGCRGKRS